MVSEFGPLATTPRTAIVTGGARRIGAALVRALSDDGWHVLIHCRRSEDEAEALAAELPHARVVEAELADPDAPAAILAAAAGMPPPGLLVNSASGFVHDTLDTLEADQWDAHLSVNLRAPAFLTRAFAAAVPAGAAGLVVNLLDAKLAAPNTDFFSYTVSKMGLAGFTELAARDLAPRGIRVCAIAPAVTLVSGPQSEANFAAVHAHNPLGRGVAVDDIVRTLRFIVATPVLTGQTITLDGGQRFLALERDVQFLPDSPQKAVP
ncbi:SDR family NAD(P)-dependent oxidoreductase [Sphingomonas solaris]|uniref:SDR family NAD(P)-dependent oxidoreductase n=1 Tax=Alterirhizorhabdus solaris TaxID=2529389 RepID=A0A558QR74_9SPHN|nr:SDR family NAD(P)-dependent oxidoreductase [Sphingomonas solaris]TVV69648.1 SDR family NAD(P)-dependent oxidoreductase [Sphingomonas solaris]